MNRARMTLGLVAAVATAGGVSAIAAGTDTHAGLGAEDVIVGSCDSDGVRVHLVPVRDPASGRVQVGRVRVEDLGEECVGKTYSVTVSTAAGQDSTVTGVVPTSATATGEFSADLPTPVPAAEVSQASVVLAD